METNRAQLQAAAAARRLQQEGQQQGHFNASGDLEKAAGGAGGSSGRATGGVVVEENSWMQPVAEEEYIDLRDAVDADVLSFDTETARAGECISESSSDEAPAEAYAEIVEEEMSANTSMDDDDDDTSEAYVSALPAASVSSAAAVSSAASASSSCHADGGSHSNKAPISSSSAPPEEERSGLRTALEVSLKGARDAICCAAVGAVSVCGEAASANAEQQVNHTVLLAALGSCDDACRVYVLPSSSSRQQQQQPMDTRRSNSSSSSVGGNATGISSSSRTRQKVAASRERMEAAVTLRDGHETISATAFSYDRKLLACGCFDGVVRVYRLRVTEASGRVNVAPLSVEAVASAAANPVASSAETKTRKNGKVEENADGVSADLAEELRGCTADVVDVSFHPRGYALLVASADQTAWVWLLPLSIVKEDYNLEESAAARNRGAVVALTVFAAAAPLTCCCFSSSGREAIVGAADGTVSVFSAKTGALLYAVKHPGINPSVRQRQHEQQQEPCSVVVVRLSSSSSAALPHIAKRAGDGTGGSGGSNNSATVSSGESVVMEKKDTQEDVLLGVGYEDGWIALVRAASGDVILSEQGHAGKAVESVSFIKITARNRVTASSRSIEEKYGSGCCYFFASGGLDGRVVIWDITHKCIRAAVVTSAPVAAIDKCLDSGGLQQQVPPAPGVTRLLVLQESNLNLCSMHSKIIQQQVGPFHEQQSLQQQQLMREGGRGVGDALICAGCTDGHLLVLDIRTGQVLLRWQAHVGALMDLVALPVVANDTAAVVDHKAVTDTVMGSVTIGGNEEVRLSQQLPQQGVPSQCSCCWRILSAGDDGIGKVWRLSR